MRFPTITGRAGLAALTALFILSSGPGPSAGSSLTINSDGDTRWIHVRVQETGGDEETVHVNLPFSLLEAVLPLIHDNDFRDGRVRLGHGMHVRVNDEDMDAVELRALWTAVRGARDGEYVTVKGKHDNVRVAKSGSMMLVNVIEQDGDKVDMKVPIPVMDALFSGKSDELNVLAAVRALATHGDIQLVTVDEDSSQVRIWVDSKNVSD